MAIKMYSQKRKNPGTRAQALVEFAIALPVLLLLLFGIMEAGRVVLIYTMVTNASREAARYASAVGRGDDGLFKYNHCAGIKQVAIKSTYNLVKILPSDILISYVDENGNNPTVCDATSGEDSGVSVDSEYRVTVRVTATYTRVVKLIPIPSRAITSTSTRTILGIFDLPNP